MKLSSPGFDDGASIPSQYAFCAPDPKNHVTLAQNQNPHLAWAGVPPGVKSFAILCCDPDVPSQGEDVNKEGRTVPASLARIDFFHWVLVDLPASEVGVNDYTSWFANDHDMSGDYYGYDGPCPPWNDEIAHRYVFTVYALDVESLALEGRFDGRQARQAIEGHVLAQASITGRYTLNPDVKI